MANQVTRKAPQILPSALKVGCWWEPPVYYRNYPSHQYYPYDDQDGRGCQQGYYAPRWSGYLWR
jgi:hypothetical protein